jgi:hypothetical protein
MLQRTTSTFDVSAFRLFYCLILAYFMKARSLYFWETSDNGIFRGLLLLKPFQGNLVEAWQMYVAVSILCGSLILAGLGWRPRWMLFVALLSHLNIYAPMNYEFRPYDDNIVFFNLLVMAIFPYSKSSTSPSWIFEFIKINLALSYFSAFISKMLNSGLEWAHGYTLQSYLFERYFMTGNKLALFVAQHYALCTVLSVFTLLAEATFWTVLIPGRLAVITAWIGFLLHVGVFMLMTINFKVFALSYLVFVPYEKIWIHIKNLQLDLNRPYVRYKRKSAQV